MVRRGLAESRSAAADLIATGAVLVGGSVARKAARQVATSDSIHVLEPPAYVSRGGHKLAAALDAFEIDVDGVRAIDVGASTGGFSDCLLQRGASEIVAVDVGRAQLHERLLADERVVSLESTDVRGLAPGDLGGPAMLVVVDVSFISVCSIATDLRRLVHDDGQVIVLVKPQFELGKKLVSRTRGVVRDPDRWSEACVKVFACTEESGLDLVGLKASPTRGRAGNVEFLAHLRPRTNESSAQSTSRATELVSEAIAAARAEATT